jgi:hypothetical protein
MLAATQRQQGQRYQLDKGKSTHVTMAMTPAQHRQQGQQHDAGNDASTMRVKCKRNAGKCQRGTSRTFERQLGNNAGATPATRTAWCWQWRQCNVGKDTSTMPKNAIAALARPSKAKLLWANDGYSNEAKGDNVEHHNNASPMTCHDCIMTGQMPVCDAGSNAGVPRVATPAQQGQKRLHDKGNNAGATPAMSTARCWQGRQRMPRLLHDWADASLQCWRQHKGNKGNNASATRAKAPTRQGQWCRRIAGNNDSAMLVMTPAQCGQGRQHNAGKDTNAASAWPFEDKSPWNDGRYGNEARGKDNDHDNDATHTDVSRLCLGWADASLRCWGWCQRNEGKEANATLVTMSAQRWKRWQHNACKDASAMQAMTPAQCRQKPPAQDWPDMKAKLPGNGTSYGNKNHRWHQWAQWQRHVCWRVTIASWRGRR